MIRKGLEQKLNVSIYANFEFNGKQMKEILLGLQKGLNVSVYAKPEYNWKEMNKIRKELFWS